MTDELIERGGLHWERAPDGETTFRPLRPSDTLTLNGVEVVLVPKEPT